MNQEYERRMDQSARGPAVGSSEIVGPLELEHRCHAKGCTVPVPPKLLMCARHWRMVPREIQSQIWEHYRPGQEVDKSPTAQYLKVMQEAINAVAAKETQRPNVKLTYRPKPWVSKMRKV